MRARGSVLPIAQRADLLLDSHQGVRPMAFLVCYCDPRQEVDLHRKAIYLDQKFYELLVRYDRTSIESGWLHKIASLGYGDRLRLPCPELEQVLRESEKLFASCEPWHPQFDSFVEVLGSAIQKKLDLVVSGDMYPDRSKRFWFARQF